MGVPEVRVTFKQTELDLYKRIYKHSSPAAFLKDCAIEHFERDQQTQLQQQPQFVQTVQDEIEIY